MRTIGVSELNQQTSRVLREVQDGESYSVTMHGRVVARILPATDQATWLERKIAEGRVTPPSAPENELPVPVRIPSGTPLDQLLEENKGED